MNTNTDSSPASPTAIDAEVQPLNESRSPDIWFDDGNVVLESLDKTHFLVHKSVLASNSPTFKHLFQSASASNEPTLDGIPVVPVYDTSTDLKHVLKALYQRTYVEILRKCSQL